MSFSTSNSEEHQFDLIVVGGGWAGLCAAISAARKGVQVALVQERPVLGGNGSSEIRVVPHGSAHSNAWTNETGLPHEILLEERSRNHEHLFDHGMVNSVTDLALHEAARRETNLTLFLNTSVRGVESEALETPTTPQPTLNNLGRLGGERRRISALRASQLGSEKELILKAPQFVDATGDGTIGFLAGADFRYGRESREEFGENLAPLQSDDVTMGSTITMRARDIGQNAPFEAPDWIEEYKSLEGIGFNRTLHRLDKPTYGGYWWLEVCNPFHQIQDNAAIRDELHRHVLGVWNFIKNHSEFKEKASTYVLDWTGMVPGKRESRRLMGDIVLTEHDVHEDKKWPDGVTYAGWWIDLHISRGILNKTEPGERENVDDNYKHWIRVAPFSIPLRAMYSRNVENLWMAGRCYSLTHVALGPVRVQLSLALQGQAVGTAAAYALQNHLSPRQTAAPEAPHIQTIRQQLLRDDSHVLGVKNCDESDLALRATATASSESAFDISAVDEKRAFALDVPRAQILPLTDEKLESVELHLQNRGSQTVRLRAELHEIERIWDRTPGQLIKAQEFEVAPGTRWAEVIFDCAVTPQRPHRLALWSADGTSLPDVFWSASPHVPIGSVAQFRFDCAGGPMEKHRHLPSFGPHEIEIPPYQHWWQMRRVAFSTRIVPAPQPFGAASVNNGSAWPETMPNVWQSNSAQSLPQWVQLAWESPQSFNTVQALFDTDLDCTVNKRAVFHRSPECIRDWRLHAQTENGWQVIYQESGNFQRRRRVQFPRLTATALRLEVLATGGVSDARVFEIRVENDQD